MMRTMLALATVLLIGAMAPAQGTLNPLDVGLGVRAMGLAGAYTALARGTEAVLYNPAGLAHQRGFRADSSYTGGMGLYGVGWVAGAAPSLGGGLAYLSVGGITDPEGAPLNYSQFALVAGGGLRTQDVPFLPIPFDAALGANFKINTARMADESAIGVALDLGFMTAFPTPLGELSAGLAIRDLGLGMSVGDSRGWSTELAVGVAAELPLGLFSALELSSHYSALGIGWQIDPLEVRMGVQLSGGTVRWALGLGVGWQQFFLDYALMTHPMLGTSHRLGFGVDLGALLGL